MFVVEDIGRHTHTKSKHRLLVVLVGSVLVAVISFLTLEAVAYVYLRAFEGYDGVHLMNYEFDDYKVIRPTPNYANWKGIYHNAQGFRERQNTPKTKEPGVFRIFLMGGSTGYGLGSLSAHGQTKYPVITNDETIDYYLEEHLKRRFPGTRIEVINAAITSHYSHHHLIYLNQTILKYDPDMVVFLDGFNDYFPYRKDFDQFIDYAYGERAHLFMSEPSFEAWTKYTGWWLFRKSHFVHVAAKAIRPAWLYLSSINRGRAHINVNEAIENLKKNAQSNFVKMIERNGLILRHEGVPAVFALQPEISFHQSKKLSRLEQEIFEEMQSHWQENFVEFKNEAKPLVTKLVQEATAKTGAIFVDLTDIYADVEGDVYTDYCHLTPLGNQKLAEALGNAITPLISSQVEEMRKGISARVSQGA